MGAFQEFLKMVSGPAPVHTGPNRHQRRQRRKLNQLHFSIVRRWHNDNFRPRSPWSPDLFKRKVFVPALDNMPRFIDEHGQVPVTFWANLNGRSGRSAVRKVLAAGELKGAYPNIQASFDGGAAGQK